MITKCLHAVWCIDQVPLVNANYDGQKSIEKNWKINDKEIKGWINQESEKSKVIN